jgi:hypothetical protein
VLANFSLHAIARFMQRAPRVTDKDLMAAMDVVTNSDLSVLEDGGGVKIVTDADGGGWRGRLAQIAGEDGSRHRIVHVGSSERANRPQCQRRRAVAGHVR